MTLRNNVKIKTLLVALFAAIAMVLTGTVGTSPAFADDPNSQWFSDYETLSQGETGQSVVVFQIFMKRMGYYSGPIDGIYGSGSKSAAQSFQYRHEIGIDGVVGPQTWNRVQWAQSSHHYYHVYATQGSASIEKCSGIAVWGGSPGYNRCHSNNHGGYSATYRWTGTHYLFWNFEDGCWSRAVQWMGSCN